VLEADALGAILETGDDLAGEVKRSFLGEETHDVGALEVAYRVAGEPGKDLGQGARILEEQVGSPLGLVG